MSKLYKKLKLIAIIVVILLTLIGFYQLVIYQPIEITMQPINSFDDNIGFEKI